MPHGLRDLAQDDPGGVSIPNDDMVIHGSDGESAVVNVSVFATPASMKSEIDVAGFLVLRKLGYQRLIRRLVAEKQDQHRGTEGRRRRLSSRELEVLALAADGLRTARIAERLSLSTFTVKNHFTNILGKLKVHRRAEAVAAALRMNLFRGEAGQGASPARPGPHPEAPGRPPSADLSPSDAPRPSSWLGRPDPATGLGPQLRESSGLLSLRPGSGVVVAAGRPAPPQIPGQHAGGHLVGAVDQVGRGPGRCVGTRARSNIGASLTPGRASPRCRSA